MVDITVTDLRKEFLDLFVTTQIHLSNGCVNKEPSELTPGEIFAVAYMAGCILDTSVGSIRLKHPIAISKHNGYFQVSEDVSTLA